MNNCTICGLQVNEGEEIVDCKQCKSKYHKSCTIINDNMEAWTCPKCNEGVLSVPPPPRSQRSRSCLSQHSKKSSRCSSTKVDLLLQSVQEEKQLLEDQQRERQKLIEDREKILQEKHKLEHQLILKKQLILQNLQDDENVSVKNASVHLPVPFVSSKDKVTDWVESNKNETADKEPEKDLNLDFPVLVKNPLHPSVSRMQSVFNDAKEPAHNAIHEIPMQSTFKEAPRDNVTFHSSRIRPSHAVSVSRILTKEQIAARQILKELPNFDGKPKSWPKFISSFQRSTDLCGFSDSENLERLSRCLQGSAYAAVESSLTLEDNVPRILEILELLFGKPEYIINSLIDDMRKSKRPTIESVESILCYALEIENISCTMKLAKLAEHLWNPILLNEMLERLPSQMKIEWAEYTYKKPVSSIEVFSLWLKEKSMKLSSLLTKPPNLSKTSRGYEKHKSSFVNVHNDSNNESTCCICQGSCQNVEVCPAFKELSYKLKWDTVKKNQICRTCLRKHRGYCRKQQACGVNSCEFLHHELLHKPDDHLQPRVDEVQPARVNAHTTSKSSCIFKVLPVIIRNGDKFVNTYAMLDDCSSLTLISQDLADELEASGPKQSLCLQWTSNVKRIESDSQILNLQISGKISDKPYQLKCRTIENLSLPKQSLDYDLLSSEFQHLKNLPVSSYSNAHIGVLIGINNPTLLLTHNYKFNTDEEPIAAFTKLGCVVFGSSKSVMNNANIFHVRECECFVDNVKLDKLIRDSYAVESLGLTKSIGIVPTEEKRASEIWEKTTKFLGDRYETGLLFKYDTFKMPNNYNLAVRRLQCLLRKCEKEIGMKSIINKKIEDHVQKGYARRIEATELQEFGNNKWYLPIFVVQNPNKPNKPRLVWDAAATTYETSLNSVLVKGPDLLSGLLPILLRFRQHKIAMSADIQEMFHQIRIRQEDQKYQLFLWPDKDGNIITYAMVGMTFGASCSPATAQHIKNLNARTFAYQYPRAVEAIVENHYVDDLLESLESEEEAIQLAKDVINIHQRAGFNIRNWVSNSVKVSNSLSGYEPEAKKTLQISTEPTMEKVLGMWWETSTDYFSYSLRYHKMSKEIWKGERVPTKREVLRAVMSIYDPLGLLSHVLIFPKILLQNIWRTESSWDEAISPHLASDWKRWIDILPSVENLKIPRWYGYNSKVNQVDIHTFTDASNEAYAAAVYMRFFDPESNSVKVILIAAKSRVAPLKYMSIPRLELMGAVVGARLAETIKINLKIQIRKFVFWTDSTCVLAWIHSDHRKYRPYVAARIGEILETTSSNDWRYVPSNCNVADEATRLKIVTPVSQCRWYNGPSFLYNEECEWPINKVKKHETEEMMSQYVAAVNVHHAEIMADNISSWPKLCRVQAYVNRFIENLKRSKQGKRLLTDYFSSQELRSSENTLYRQAQEEGYPEEISSLESNVCTVSKNSPVFKDSPYLDEFKVMRAKSRIDAVNGIPLSVKRPILLPKNNRITNLIMMFFHKMYHHGNSETVINEMRQKFIIPSMRVKLRSIKNQCQWCKNRTAKPQTVIMGNLPTARLATFARAFTCIGIDYFGPLYVAVKRSREKRWVILITCLTTRAVHLEIAHSLSTDSCILGLRRFMNRRGTPRQIYSDNATNFKSASKELKAAMEKVNGKLVALHFTTSDTEWSFIPPASPHMGGAWERMVRSVKSIISSTFPFKTTPNDETLLSVLLEAENIINSRPLTYVPLDNETDEAITPNHFILGSSNGLKSLGEFEADGSTLRSFWKQSQLYADIIWRKWVKEVLPDLRRRSKWHTEGRPIKLNDIVLIIEENTPRNCYKKAMVIGLNTGHDGRIRSVTLQTGNSILVRPISKLAVLDVYSQKSNESIPTPSEGILGGSVENTNLNALDCQHPRQLRPLPHRK